MLTRNFMNSIGTANGGMSLDNTPGVTNINGGTGDNLPFTQYCGSNWTTYSRFNIGSGKTKPKSTDYCLENKITEGYDCSTLTKRYVQGKEKDKINISGIITNNSSNEIQFSEVGLFVAVGSSESNKYMLAREVYDTPVTIAPGESVAVNVNII